MSQTVLVTGAAKGIGAATIREFASKGYQVCIHYHTSKQEATMLQQELVSQGVRAITYQANVADRQAVDAMIDFVISELGSIDVLVNNAGICEYKLFTDITEDDMKHMIDTTIMGTFHVTQSVLKKVMLPNKKGSIINISSVWGMVGASCEVGYSTAKAAVIGMTKALAKELGLSHIRVNAVAPGAIETDMMRMLSDEDRALVTEEIPLSRIGDPEEVAKVILFLASEDASYITGQVISPNGGYVI